MFGRIEFLTSTKLDVDWRFRRLADIFLAVILLTITGWAMLSVALLIQWDSPGPVFFVQQRLGRHRRPFNCIKFRTMNVDAECKSGPVWATRMDPRVTRIGCMLRRMRLDELPQLLNVLQGSMAIVGPRPIRQHFADQLTVLDRRFERRFEVRPGLTGWAQVSLDYPSTVEAQLQKLDYDLYYIEHRSFWFDLRIIALTFGVVLMGKGT
jgi:lipopolysaccharide/colanic/teichoic acid biosynthesis glycosyltransferase